MKKAMINYIKSPKFDDIYTPSYAIEPLLEYIPKGITVWECCDFGKSEITRLLKEHGCNVISTDKEENFFEYKPTEHFDMIITNPPYSLKDDFIAKCYEWGKPFALLEYLIKTYTNDGDLVLDNCMGSGSTGVACVNTNRNFIGIELDENYFNIAKERINNAVRKD